MPFPFLMLWAKRIKQTAKEGNGGAGIPFVKQRRSCTPPKGVALRPTDKLRIYSEFISFKTWMAIV